MKVEERITEIDHEMLRGPIENTISYLSSLKKEYPNHTNLHLQIEYGYDGEATLWLCGTREETQLEKQRRLAKLRKERLEKADKLAEQDAKDRKELQRLSKKYGVSLKGLDGLE